MAKISLLTLANHAEVREGFLYLCGGEWDTITRTYPAGEEPQPLSLGVAISVVIPWTESNEPHKAELWIEDEDARSQVMATSVKIEVSRPPDKVPGSDTRVPIAISGVIEFPQAGGYRVLARVGKSQEAYSFRVIDHLT